MHPLPLLPELAIIALVGTVVSVLLAKLKLPTVAGLLVAGALLGPHALGLVAKAEAIEVLAEIGVVLLLFTIGLEFSFSRLKHIFRRVALGGLVQVGATGATAAGIAAALGAETRLAIFIGFVFALSSTAIVLRLLGQRGELDAPHGRFIVGTLIFQDLCVVPMVLLVPALASDLPGAEVAQLIGLSLAKAAGVVVGTLVLARVVVPRVLRLVDASRSREVFLLAVLAICIGTAWATSLVGLSVALGAFLAGMVVADTEFQHRALGDLIPLRDAFLSIFFVSLGMLFAPQSLIDEPLLVIGLVLGFTLGKGALAALAAAVMRFPARATWLAGVGLAQFGEFGFVLVQIGGQTGLVEPELTTPLLSAGILSMLLTPIMIHLAPDLHAGERLLAPLTRLFGGRELPEAPAEPDLRGHVIVIGYGMAGQTVRRSLAALDVEHLVLELNAETVRTESDNGVPISYADATSREVLEHAGLAGAQALVVLINDPAAAERVVATARTISDQVPILIRTRYHADVPRLLELGASDVVVEEVEAGAEVLDRILACLDAPEQLIESHRREIRAAGSPTGACVDAATGDDSPPCDHLGACSALIRPGDHAAGRSLADLDVRARTGALVVAISRGAELIEAPDAAHPIQTGDVITLAGSPESIERARTLLEGGEAG